MLSSVRERAPLRSKSLYGIVCGFDLAKPTMLMAELHDESRMNFSRDVLTLNFGLRHEFAENYILIVSMGHELRSPDQSTALIGYFEYSLSTNGVNSLLKRAFTGRSGSRRQSPPRARAISVTAQSQAAFCDRFVGGIAKRGSERASQNERAQNKMTREKLVRYKEERSTKVIRRKPQRRRDSQFHCVGHPIAKRRP